MLLLISERTAWWKDFAVRLNQQGIFLFLSPFRTGTHFCKTRATGGVLIDCHRNLAAGEALCKRLRTRYPELPIAAYVSEKAIPDMPVSCLIRATDSNVLWEEVLAFCKTDCGWDTETLSTHSLTVGNDPEQTLYMGCPLPLSPCGHLILRCLFYRAPKITSAKDLMRLCYPGEDLHINNLAVQIQRINEKAAAIDPRPLIVNERAKGYRLRDGILL